MEDRIRIAGIVKESIVDGPGIRLVVFTQGCIHNCSGCHNPDTHDLNGGYDMKIGEIIDLVKRDPLLSGVTISGGEPLLQGEQSAKIAREVKNLGLNVIVYTGYKYEGIKENLGIRDDWKELLKYTDYLIDGRYEEKEKDLLLKFRGSRNQRIIDIKETEKQDKIIEVEL